LVYAEIKKSGYENKLRAGIMLTGGTAQIKGVERIFKEVTKMHVQVGTPKGLETTGFYDQVRLDNSYATAIGLAWANIKPLDPRMDFSADLVNDVSEQLVEKETKKEKSGKSWFSMTSIKEFMGGLINDDLKGQDRY
jgi:cell division protein FtsA